MMPLSCKISLQGPRRGRVEGKGEQVGFGRPENLKVPNSCLYSWWVPFV
jgi:hypothetical protein